MSILKENAAEFLMLNHKFLKFFEKHQRPEQMRHQIKGFDEKIIFDESGAGSTGGGGLPALFL